jgi:hemerythrin
LFSFSWKSNYSLGIKGLDQQHQAIMDCLSQLHVVLMSGRMNEAAAPLIDHLVSVAQEHFATEERLMESTRFPGLDDHRAKHQALSKRVAEFIARHEKGDKAAYSQFMYFLRGWITRHMQKEDHEYAPWLAEHGIR